MLIEPYLGQLSEFRLTNGIKLKRSVSSFITFRNNLYEHYLTSKCVRWDYTTLNAIGRCFLGNFLFVFTHNCLNIVLKLRGQRFCNLVYLYVFILSLYAKKIRTLCRFKIEIRLLTH
jgi:hypothetical protein